MIDTIETVERLVARLNVALPIPARITPERQASLCQQTGGTIPAQCAVTWITYMGDEGGIVCKLDLGSDAAKEAFTSITHCASTRGYPWRAKSPPIRSTASNASVVSRPDLSATATV